jgi:hyperosmotically inducible protein
MLKRAEPRSASVRGTASSVGLVNRTVDPPFVHPLEESIPMKRIIATTFAVAFATAGVVAVVPSSAYATDMPAESDQPVTDTWITTKVKAELATTEGVKSTEISVKTVDGTVALVGVLPTQLAVDKAVAATRSIKGVHAVDDSGLKVK